MITDVPPPGRHAAATQLITLLRPPAEDAETPNDLRRLLEDEGDLSIKADPIAPARGIALGVALSVPVCGAIGALIYVLLK